jgi:phospholipid/cholesterol/gamma-HCH transport system substrate-binding protein
MPFTFNKFQKAVALFIVIGISLILVVLIFIIKGNNLFEKKVYYYTFLNQTYGLSSGSQIKYKGILIGKVKKLNLTKIDQVYVEFYIFEGYNYLMKKDSVLKVSSGFLGGGGLTIFVGKKDNAIPNSLIYSSDMEEGMHILASEMTVQKGGDLTDKAQQVLDMILEMKPVIYRTLVNINDITKDIKTITGSLKGDDKSKVGDEIFNVINSINLSLKKIDSSIDKINSILNSKNNSIGSILNDENELYNSIMKSISSLNISISNINSLLTKFSNTPDDLKKIMMMLQENLIQLKYVLENLPLIPKSDTKSSSTSIGGSGR